MSDTNWKQRDSSHIYDGASVVARVDPEGSDGTSYGRAYHCAARGDYHARWEVEQSGDVRADSEAKVIAAAKAAAEGVMGLRERAEKAERERDEAQALAAEMRATVEGMPTDSGVDDLRARVATLEATLRMAHATLTDVRGVMDESEGVTGWHKNGDVAAWGEFGFDIDATVAALDAALAGTTGAKGDGRG